MNINTENHPKEHKNCRYYSEPVKGELTFCYNKENKNQDEGNCTVENCPLISKDEASCRR